MTFANVGGLRLWYRRSGSGAPLVQIGGAGSSHHSFDPIRGLLQLDCEVIDMDLPGYGRSEAVSGQATIEGWATLVAGLLDVIGLDSFDMHGSSLGGMVALRVASLVGARIRRLILSATSARVDGVGAARLRIWRALVEAYGTTSPALAAALAADMLPSDALDGAAGRELAEGLSSGLRENVTAEVFAAACEAVATADLVADCPRVVADTLVLHGEGDQLFRLNSSDARCGPRRIARDVPRSRLTVLPHVSHTVLREAPGRSARAITEFLGRGM